MQTAAKVSVSEIALVLLLTKRVGELSEEQTNSVGKEDNENAPKTTDQHVRHSTTENGVAGNNLQQHSTNGHAVIEHEANRSNNQRKLMVFCRSTKL